MKHWTLEQIPWTRFDPSRVDPEIVKLVKAAAMVEFNGGDYATYLNRVFADDPEFQAVATDWAQEEVQHGQALARWAKLADPDFDFETAFKRFTAGFSIDVDTERSVRGSRAGELVARCIVETGTSSYYAALREATDEPVLKEICRNIAADELRHYKLFYSHLRRYLERERLAGWKRLNAIAKSKVGSASFAHWARARPCWTSSSAHAVATLWNSGSSANTRFR